MKIALIQVNFDRLTERATHPHAGLAYLGAYALRKGHETRAVDAQYEGIDNTEVFRRIVVFSPDVLGISVRTPEIREAEKLARKVRERLPAVKIVVGGAHASGVYERILHEGRDFDVAVIGEGEETFSELLDHFERGDDLRDIKGILYRERGAVVRTDERPWRKNLDDLLYPAWNLFPNIHDVSLFTSRGCPFSCIFCQRVMGNVVRMMSPERVVREIVYDIETFGARFFQIEDEVFGLNRQWTLRTLQLMHAAGVPGRTKWFANSRVNIADLEVYRSMKAAGCIGLGFGIESGNQTILDRIQKGITLQNAARAIALAKKAGLRTHAFFILGHPHETKKSVRETIDFACRLNTTKVSFGTMVPYPGTGIHAMAKRGEGGYRFFHEEWEKYTKYFGKGLEVEDLSSGMLGAYQRRAYLEFYLRNFRFRDLLDLARKYQESPRAKPHN